LEQRNTAKIVIFLVDVCVKYNISPEIAEMSREKISIPGDYNEMPLNQNTYLMMK
jgi:hypothetical protein